MESSIISTFIEVYIFHLFFGKAEMGLYLLVFQKKKGVGMESDDFSSQKINNIHKQSDSSLRNFEK